MKKWIGRMAVLLAFVLTLSGSTLAAFGKIPSATKEFYVNDYAGVFSDTWKEELCKAGEQLYEDTTAQLVVLTVDTTDGEDISDYAVETGRKWGIGSKKKNNGVLIVLSVSDRKVWVSVGYGLEGKLPDSKTGRLLDEYAVPSYKDNQFEKGTVELYYALLNEIREEYGLEKITAPRYEKVQQDVDDDEDEDEGTVWEIALGLVMIVLLMVGAYLLCVMLPVFLIVTMVLVLKGLIMKLSGKDTADYWKKNFSRMSVLHRLFNSLFPLSWILGRGEKAAAEVPVMTMTEMMIMTATTAEAPETEEASAVAVQAGISSGVGMNRRFSCTAQAELSNALDKISQLCYNDENQFREGVIRV